MSRILSSKTSFMDRASDKLFNFHMTPTVTRPPETAVLYVCLLSYHTLTHDPSYGEGQDEMFDTCLACARREIIDLYYLYFPSGLRVFILYEL